MPQNTTERRPIERFSTHGRQLHDHEEGGWVRYEDHHARVLELEEELRGMRELLGGVLDADTDSFIDVARGANGHDTEHRCLVCGYAECEPDCLIGEIRKALSTPPQEGPNT